MRLEILNGIEANRQRLSPTLNGFSRVNVENNNEMDGFSRVNLNGRFSLNGYTLNGQEMKDALDLQDYFEECLECGKMPTMQGFLNGRAERRARRAARKERRAKHREQREAKKEFRRTRGQRREERRAARREERSARREQRGKGFQSFLSAAKDVAQNFLPGKEGAATDFIDTYDEVSDYADEKGLFKPKPFTARWWNNLPMWQKATIIGGGVLVADYATGGNLIINKLSGKKTARKRR